MKIAKIVVAVVMTVSLGSEAPAVVMSSVNTYMNGSGNKVFDVSVNFDNQLGTSQLLVDISVGSIVGTSVSDNPVTPKPPIVASDNISFVAQGADTFTGLSNDSNPMGRNREPTFWWLASSLHPMRPGP